MELARRLGHTATPAELVSADSMQVYRTMDVGTAKATAQDQAEIPHHLLDVVDPHEDFTLGEFQRRVFEAFDDIEARNRRTILVGGTGLYVRAIVDRLELPGQFPDTREQLEAEPDTTALHARLAELDPLAASRMEPTNRRRVLRALEVTVGSGRAFSSFGPGLEEYPATDFILIGIDLPRPLLDERINARYSVQIDLGFLDEVRSLARSPQGMSRTAAQALGYKELLEHVQGNVALDDALELARQRTRRFARRQQRWFRRDPRITWFDASDGERLRNVDGIVSDVLRECGPWE